MRRKGEEEEEIDGERDGLYILEGNGRRRVDQRDKTRVRAGRKPYCSTGSGQAGLTSTLGKSTGNVHLRT